MDISPDAMFFGPKFRVSLGVGVSSAICGVVGVDIAVIVDWIGVFEGSGVFGVVVAGGVSDKVVGAAVLEFVQAFNAKSNIPKISHLY